MRRRLLVSIAMFLLQVPSASGAPPAVPPEPVLDPAQPWLVPPVDGVIGRRFQAPQTDWGPGHRGIDYLLPSSQDATVRAAANGRVLFAGEAAGISAVTIEHFGGLHTTYSRLSEIYVEVGEFVTQGTWIGRAGTAHGTLGAGLHFGVKLEGEYVDPEDYLGPLDVAEAIYLTPLIGDWADEIPNYSAGSYLDEACGGEEKLIAAPPNDNIAVVVPGIATETRHQAGEFIFGVPGALGYEPDRTFHFSYEGSDGPRLHEPYDRIDTYQNIRSAAGKLVALLVRIARRHPGADVDLIAHSQGGLIARAALENMLIAWQRGIPRVDHLVTFATPHQGTRIASSGRDIADGTITGRWVVRGASDWARRGGPIPDPYSDVVADQRPGSRTLDRLAAVDVVLGTRALSLSIANDLLVPANRAMWSGQTNRALAPEGISGHSEILRSETGLGLARAWLRDAPLQCAEGGDHLAPAAGMAVDTVHWILPELYAQAEEWLLKRAWSGLARRWRR